jgi:hypothetical protein
MSADRFHQSCGLGFEKTTDDDRAASSLSKLQNNALIAVGTIGFASEGNIGGKLLRDIPVNFFAIVFHIGGRLESETDSIAFDGEDSHANDVVDDNLLILLAG